MKLVKTTIWFAFWLFHSACMAEDAVIPDSEKINSGGYLLQVVIALAAVVAMIFALAWLVKRVSQGSVMGGGQMKVVASLALGTRERIAVVDVAGTQILVGITPGQITNLQTFEVPIIETQKKSSEDFSQKLKEIMSQGLSSQKTLSRKMMGTEGDNL